jgi:hypothetical protein
MQDESTANPVSYLNALAVATTIYHEAAPDRIEQARLQYEEALYQFKTAQAVIGSGEIRTVRVGTADASKPGGISAQEGGRIGPATAGTLPMSRRHAGALR